MRDGGTTERSNSAHDPLPPSTPVLPLSPVPLPARMWLLLLAPSPPARHATAEPQPRERRSAVAVHHTRTPAHPRLASARARPTTKCVSRPRAWAETRRPARLDRDATRRAAQSLGGIRASAGQVGWDGVEWDGNGADVEGGAEIRCRHRTRPCLRLAPRARETRPAPPRPGAGTGLLRTTPLRTQAPGRQSMHIRRRHIPPRRPAPGAWGGGVGRARAHDCRRRNSCRRAGRPDADTDAAKRERRATRGEANGFSGERAARDPDASHAPLAAPPHSHSLAQASSIESTRPRPPHRAAGGASSQRRPTPSPWGGKQADAQPHASSRGGSVSCTQSDTHERHHRRPRRQSPVATHPRPRRPARSTAPNRPPPSQSQFPIHTPAGARPPSVVESARAAFTPRHDATAPPPPPSARAAGDAHRRTVAAWPSRPCARVSGQPCGRLVFHAGGLRRGGGGALHALCGLRERCGRRVGSPRRDALGARRAFRRGNPTPTRAAHIAARSPRTPPVRTPTHCKKAADPALPTAAASASPGVRDWSAGGAYALRQGSAGGAGERARTSATRAGSVQELGGGFSGDSMTGVPLRTRTGCPRLPMAFCCPIFGRY